MALVAEILYTRARNVYLGHSIELLCGLPCCMAWYYEKPDHSYPTSVPIAYTDTMHIRNATLKHYGTFFCIGYKNSAKNQLYVTRNVLRVYGKQLVS